MIHLIQKVIILYKISLKHIKWIYLPQKNREIYPTFTTNQCIYIPRKKWGDISNFSTNQTKINEFLFLQKMGRYIQLLLQINGNQWIYIPRKNLFLYTSNFSSKSMEISPNPRFLVHSDFCHVFVYKLIFQMTIPMKLNVYTIL